MPVYRYRGRDPGGMEVTGEIEAANEQMAAELLFSRQVIPLEVKVGKAKDGNIDLKRLLIRKVSLTDMVIFTRQMYSLTKAGIPILRAIIGLSEGSISQRLKDALKDIVAELESGRTLSTAMTRHPKVFSKLYISLVHVGENTGQLEASFMQLGTYLEQEMETRKRIKAAMRYPTFVLITIVAALVILNIFVIPTFAEMFTRFNAELPLPTKILINTSNFFVNYWPFMLAAALLLFGGIRYYVSTDKGRWYWDKLKLKMPVSGDIIERSTLARYARSFAMMANAGVPMTHALSLVAEAVDNSFMAERIVAMRQGIERGETLLRVSNSSELFTPLVLQMVAVGEETGRIDELLVEAADFYEREVDYDLKTLTARIEPILIGIVAGMVLLLALGIFLPMWDMMGTMTGR